MSNSWVIQNLERALNVWNDKQAEMWSLIAQSPQQFHDGTIWDVIATIHSSLQVIGYGLLTLFFVIGMMKTAGSFAELKRPEHALRLFLRFALAKAAITYGMELLLAFVSVVQGVIRTVMETAGVGGTMRVTLPPEIVAAVEDTSFLAAIPLWAVTLIGGVLIWALSFIMILSVYGRFFRLYMYAAIAPIPLACFAGEPTQNVGRSFIKSFAAVCLEGAVIVTACVIFSAFAQSPPAVEAGVDATAMVWSYIGETAFQMLVLVGAVKAADRIVKEMLGL